MLPITDDSGWLNTNLGRCLNRRNRKVKFYPTTDPSIIDAFVKVTCKEMYGQDKVVKQRGEYVEFIDTIDSGG